ncbi:uncharacterized protein BcabD6B2_13280 [Babesia caballi]|uniref:Uncharacterized protein n=1 Tax=Babesia caballi TaxID=5871 RepID=A0AAV4LQ94_BABCB|nr:hypothetical protein, conserved [Babesia caballi]
MVHESLTEVPVDMKEAVDWIMAIKSTGGVQDLAVAVRDLFEEGRLGVADLSLLREVRDAVSQFLSDGAFISHHAARKVVKRIKNQPGQEVAPAEDFNYFGVSAAEPQNVPLLYPGEEQIPVEGEQGHGSFVSIEAPAETFGEAHNQQFGEENNQQFGEENNEAVDDSVKEPLAEPAKELLGWISPEPLDVTNPVVTESAPATPQNDSAPVEVATEALADQDEVENADEDQQMSMQGFLASKLTSSEITKAVKNSVDSISGLLKKIRKTSTYESAYGKDATWEKCCAPEPNRCAEVMIGIAPLFYATLHQLRYVSLFTNGSVKIADESKKVGAFLKNAGFDMERDVNAKKTVEVFRYNLNFLKDPFLSKLLELGGFVSVY